VRSIWAAGCLLLEAVVFKHVARAGSAGKVEINKVRIIIFKKKYVSS
jgi:hypothetical protein